VTRLVVNNDTVPFGATADVIILVEIFPLTSLNQNIGGDVCVPGIPGGVDATVYVAY